MCVCVCVCVCVNLVKFLILQQNHFSLPYCARAEASYIFSSLFSSLQENRPGHHTCQSRLGSRSGGSKKVKSNRTEAGFDTVGSGSCSGCRVDEISLGFAMGMGFPPWKRHSSRLASRRGVLSLQATCKGLWSCQGKATYSWYPLLEYLNIHPLRNLLVFHS